MTIRSRREIVTFSAPFRIKGIDRVSAAGEHDIIISIGSVDLADAQHVDVQHVDAGASDV